MPKTLIPAGWVQSPCLYLLPADSPAAKQCGECKGDFSLWNGCRHCRFCGYVFHRNSCSSKVPVPGQFFKQRACPTCYYYRNTAAALLSKGEDFECLSSSGLGSAVSVRLSLSEDIAELVLCWKAQALKETADLAVVEVRKGFSHMAYAVGASVGDYEPLRCFSLFLTDAMGEQSTCHLKAPSALTCQLWVEGLKAARSVYQRMLEQAQADKHYQDKEEEGTWAGGKKTKSICSKKWYRQRYLPLPSSSSPPSVSEEWENIPFPGTTATASEACGFTTSAVFPLPHKYSTSSTSHSSGYLSAPTVLGTSQTSPSTPSSGYLSDISLHSNCVARRPLSSCPSNRHKRHTHTTTSCSLPPTPGVPFSFSSSTAFPFNSHTTAKMADTTDSLKSRPPRFQASNWLSSQLAWFH